MKLVAPFLIYFAAALAEIAGCFTFWRWLRAGESALWIAPGLLCLAAFALLLTRVPSDTAGRAYAAYGGVYITSSLVWLRVIEGRTPDGWEMLGGVICLAGAGVILFAPRAT